MNKTLFSCLSFLSHDGLRGMLLYMMELVRRMLLTWKQMPHYSFSNTFCSESMPMSSICCFPLLICVWFAGCTLSLALFFLSFVAFVMVLKYRSKVWIPNYLKVKCSTVVILSSLSKLKLCVNMTRWDPHEPNLPLLLLLL